MYAARRVNKFLELRTQARKKGKRPLTKAAVSWTKKAGNGGSMHEWCILRMVGETIQTVGYVFAADEDTAISEAIKKFDLVGRDLEIVAHRVPQPP